MPLSILTALARVITPPDRPTSSGAEVTTADGRSLPLIGAKLRAEAKGGIARLVLEQTFENRHDETLHVTYRMPLPADGAVSAYAFDIAGRTIAGRVDKKQAAREQFERAVAEGKTAALLEQNRADLFTQEIGNLPAHEALVARITVDQQLAWLPEGEWELRFPTVIGPRYIGLEDSEQDARETHIEVADGVPARISIEVAIGDTLVAGRRVSSPSHAVTTTVDNVIVLGKAAALDRDIVVRWPVATRDVGLSLDHMRRPDGESFGLLTIVPPARDARPSEAPRSPLRSGSPLGISRDLIVLLDTSGSMSGPPLEKAKHVVAMLIESLDEHDRLELIEFSMAARRYQLEPVPGTKAAKQDAIKWVRSRSAGGGTEMGSAVHEALKALRPGAQRQVVLVTDGYVGGEQQIVKLLHEKLPKSCRLHVLGIGSAVNRSLATALARAGRGAEVLVGLDEDIERGAKRLVDRTRMPVLTNVEVLGSALVRCAPEHIPDVFEGAPVIAAVALRPEGGELVVRGDLANDTWVQRITIPPKPAGEGNPAIASLYAREHVADLETRWTIGDQEALDREIEATGVKYQIATRLTSWVAIDEARRVDGPSRHEVMPQALPYGTSVASFGMRAAVSSYDQKSLMIGGAAAPMAMAAPSSAVGGRMFRSADMAPPAVMRTKSSRSPLVSLLMVAFVLALIAALVWWLVL